MKPNTETTRSDKTVGVYRPNGGQYQVVSDKLELPRGSHFVTLPVPVEAGQLAMFDLAGHLIVGRWNGRDSLALPGLLIELTGAVPYRVLGRVIPVELTARQVTDLPEFEYGRFFANPFPRTL